MDSNFNKINQRNSKRISLEGPHGNRLKAMRTPTYLDNFKMQISKLPRHHPKSDLDFSVPSKIETPTLCCPTISYDSYLVD